MAFFVFIENATFALSLSLFLSRHNNMSSLSLSPQIQTRRSGQPASSLRRPRVGPNALKPFNEGEDGTCKGEGGRSGRRREERRMV